MKVAKQTYCPEKQKGRASPTFPTRFSLSASTSVVKEHKTVWCLRTASISIIARFFKNMVALFG
jgi:hypothetical protein